MTDLDQGAREAQALANRLKPLLAGNPPEIMGGALAELVSLWLAGHYPHGPEMIETILEQFIEVVRKLAVINVDVLKGRRQ